MTMAATSDRKDRSGKWIRFVLISVILIALDQVTKMIAVRTLKDGPHNVIPGVFEFAYLENHGAAFGILQNQQWFFFLVTMAFLVFVVWFYSRIPEGSHYRFMRFTCILLTSGAAGNLIDRMVLHYVRDFFYFVLINFPIFNVADIYVTCSAAFLVIMILFVYKDDDFAFLHGKREDA